MSVPRILLAVWIVLCCNSFAFSQEMEVPSGEPEPFFWAIIVSDMEASLSWYEENLGLSVLYHNSYEERGYKQAAMQRPGLLLELIELETAVMPSEITGADGEEARLGGFFKVGFRVSDFDAWYRKAEQSGVKFRGRVVNNPVSGKRTVIMLDPDGNRVQLFEK